MTYTHFNEIKQRRDPENGYDEDSATVETDYVVTTAKGAEWRLTRIQQVGEPDHEEGEENLYATTLRFTPPDGRPWFEIEVTDVFDLGNLPTEAARILADETIRHAETGEQRWQRRHPGLAALVARMERDGLYRLDQLVHQANPYHPTESHTVWTNDTRLGNPWPLTQAYLPAQLLRPHLGQWSQDQQNIAVARFVRLLEQMAELKECGPTTRLAVAPIGWQPRYVQPERQALASGMITVSTPWGNHRYGWRPDLPAWPDGEGSLLAACATDIAKAEQALSATARSFVRAVRSGEIGPEAVRAIQATRDASMVCDEGGHYADGDAVLQHYHQAEDRERGREPSNHISVEHWAKCCDMAQAAVALSDLAAKSAAETAEMPAP